MTNTIQRRNIVKNTITELLYVAPQLNTPSMQYATCCCDKILPYLTFDYTRSSYSWSGVATLDRKKKSLGLHNTFAWQNVLYVLTL